VIVHGVRWRERAPEGGSIELGGVTRKVESAFGARGEDVTERNNRTPGGGQARETHRVEVV
jgi:hypothetical protein